MAGGNDSFTKILLHMQGTNGGTSFPDSNVGGSAHTWTAAGNAVTSTAVVKFGSSSGVFDGTLDFLTTSDSADFTLGSGDWTIDTWFNWAAGTGTSRFICGQSNVDGAATTRVAELLLSSSNTIVGIVFVGGTSTQVNGTSTFTTTGWHHAAFVRTGNTLKLFVDGVQEGGDVSMSGTINDSANAYGVGCLGEYTLNCFYGYISEFRLSVGTARWTANFTPPTIPYGFELTSALGTYALTGKAATKAVGRQTSVGAFAFTGMAVVFNKALRHTAAVASFALITLASTRAIGRQTSVASYLLTANTSTRAIGRQTSVGAFTLTGQAATQAVARVTSAAAFALTGLASTRAIGRASAKATFVLTAMANLMTRIVAPARKFKLRLIQPILQELRRGQPVLSNRHKRD